MQIIERTGLFIAEQLQLEHHLIQADANEYCIINTESSPAIVMGISGKAPLLIDEQRNTLPVIRRFSGGGTVVIDEDTIFLTLICNTNSHSFPPYPEPILRWVFTRLLSVTPQLLLQENDFVLGEKKCGGNALYIKKNRWLIHTSFLWDYDPEKMNLLKYPPKTPAYRGARSHTEFLCCLKDHLPNRREWIQQILSTFAQYVPNPQSF